MIFVSKFLTGMITQHIRHHISISKYAIVIHFEILMFVSIILQMR